MNMAFTHKVKVSHMVLKEQTESGKLKSESAYSNFFLVLALMN